MKIGVLSDSHGYIDRVALAMEKFFADAEVILHAGDVLYHGPNNPNYKGDITIRRLWRTLLTALKFRS